MPKQKIMFRQNPNIETRNKSKITKYNKLMLLAVLPIIVIVVIIIVIIIIIIAEKSSTGVYSGRVFFLPDLFNLPII